MSIKQKLEAFAIQKFLESAMHIKLSTSIIIKILTSASVIAAAWTSMPHGSNKWEVLTFILSGAVVGQIINVIQAFSNPDGTPAGTAYDSQATATPLKITGEER